MKKLIIILLAISGCYSGIMAQAKAKGEKKVEVITNDKTGWHKIGEMAASFKKERDEMVVIGADRFAAIKIKVTEADINISDLEVYYENGTKQDISVKSIIKNGDESRVIDLNGGERSLKKIVFVYKTLAPSTSDKAHLEVWGLKTNDLKKNKSL